MAFDLGKLLAEVSDSDTGREQIEYIDLDLLDEDDANFYATEGIESLAANIATVGLLDPLRIRPNPDAPGRYRVVSGHRRRKALGLLKQDDPERWGKAACIEEENSKSPALQELRLIFANKDNRKMSSADLSEQALRVENLLYQLQEEGYEFPGRMRDHVAKAVGASTTKLARLKMIREHLHDCWKDAYKSSDLKESPAYDISRMKPEHQALLFDAYKRKISAVGSLGLSSLESQLNEIEAFQCITDNQSQPCENVERMMKKSVREDSGWKRCSCCCLKCKDLKSCKYSCPKAYKKKQKLKNAETTAKQKAADEDAMRKEEHCNEMRVLYSRLGKALAVAGISVKDYTAKVRTGYSSSVLEGYLEGSGFNAFVTPPYGSTYDVKPLVDAADVLGCSIDYLLGRDVPGPGVEPEIQPVLAWGEAFEDPVDPGEYVVLAKWSEHGKMKPHTFVWDGDKWLYSDLDAAAAGAIVCYWMPMPEE